MLEVSNWPGLMAAINAAGYTVEQRDNAVIAVRLADGATGQAIDDAAAAIVAAYPVSATADAVCKTIEALATSKRNLVISAYSPGEMASWPIKRAEALAYQASGDINDAPNLTTEATYRGVPLLELVTKVLNDASRFSRIEAAIAGVSGKHRDAVRLLTTHNEISGYNYNTDWPV